MKRISIALLCWLLGSAVAQAANPYGLPSFGAYIQSKSMSIPSGLTTEGVRVASAEAQTQPAQNTETYCLQDVRWRTCENTITPPPNLLWQTPGFVAITDVACCEDQRPQQRPDGDMEGMHKALVRDFDLGSCQWDFTSASLFNFWIDNTFTTNLAGSVKGTCFLKAASESCSSSNKGGMVATINAFVYYTPMYSYLPDNQIPTGSTCSNTQLTLCFWWGWYGSLGNTSCPGWGIPPNYGWPGYPELPNNTRADTAFLESLGELSKGPKGLLQGSRPVPVQAQGYGKHHHQHHEHPHHYNYGKHRDDYEDGYYRRNADQDNDDGDHGHQDSHYRRDSDQDIDDGDHGHSTGGTSSPGGSDPSKTLYFGNGWVIYGTVSMVQEGSTNVEPVGLIEWVPFVDLWKDAFPNAWGPVAGKPTYPAPFVQQGTTKLVFKRRASSNY